MGITKYGDPGRDIIPATSVFLITPSNTENLAHPTRGIAFSAEGTLKILSVEGEEVTIPEGVLVSGIIHPIRAKRVFATGTTVTDIVGFA